MRPNIQALRALSRIKVPAALLIAFLQRTPAASVVEAAGEFVVESPIGVVLKSAFAAIASMGAIQSVAGATVMVTTQPSPVNAKVGTAITPVGFTVTNTINIASWRIGGNIPPGLTLAATQGGASLTGPGVLDATHGAEGDGYGGMTPGNSTTTPLLSGTPTQAGTFTFTLQAFEFAATTGLVSNVFNFTVNVAAATTAPTFTAQPSSKTVTPGSTAVFSVTASDASTYQWRLNGANLAGATSPLLVIRNANGANAGTYTCVATNTVGSVTSVPATLTLSATADFGRVINLSILTSLSAGEGVFTLGTVVGGEGAIGNKAVVIRAAGPALATIGVGGVLPDPKLQMFSGANAVASNDNWNGSADLAAAFAQVGAFAYGSATSKDAAIFNPVLAQGAYTVQISDAGNATGTVIAELYDATPAAAFTATTPRLVNVSVLKQIGAGTNLTAGFFIGGSTAKTLLIRATGPGLARFGLGGLMTDPKLDLFSGSNVIASNDNWGGDPQIVAVASAVGGFSIDDPASKDAALLVTLAPGAYTAQVSGVGGGGGQAIVEVYEVP